MLALDITLQRNRVLIFIAWSIKSHNYFHTTSDQRESALCTMDIPAAFELKLIKEKKIIMVLVL